MSKPTLVLSSSATKISYVLSHHGNLLLIRQAKFYNQPACAVWAAVEQLNAPFFTLEIAHVLYLHWDLVQ